MCAGQRSAGISQHAPPLVSVRVCVRVSCVSPAVAGTVGHAGFSAGSGVSGTNSCSGTR